MKCTDSLFRHEVHHRNHRTFLDEERPGMGTFVAAKRVLGLHGVEGLASRKSIFKC